MEIRQKLKIPEISSINDLFINYDGEELKIESSSIDLKDTEREFVQELCKTYGVSFDGEKFFVKKKGKNFDFNKINKMIEGIKLALIDFVSHREKTEVLSVRLPIHLKAKILEISDKLNIPLPQLLERMLSLYRRSYPSLFEKTTREMSIKEVVERREEVIKTFTPIKKLKPLTKKLKILEKMLKRSFRKGVLVTTRVMRQRGEKFYTDLILFLERPRVNIWFNMSTFPKVYCFRIYPGENFLTDELKEKMEKSKINWVKRGDLLFLERYVKNVGELVKATKSIVNFLRKEKIDWGWWYI